MASRSTAEIVYWGTIDFGTHSVPYRFFHPTRLWCRIGFRGIMAQIFGPKTYHLFKFNIKFTWQEQHIMIKEITDNNMEEISSK